MKEMITIELIQKLMLTEPLDIVDKDQVYFTISEYLEIELCVNYSAYADSDEDGDFDNSTYKMEITMLYIEVNDKFLPLIFTREELRKFTFSDEVEEIIRERYLND